MPLKTASVTRAAVRVAVSVVAITLLWLIAAFQFFYSPPQATPHHTDAIVVLGGLSKERLPVAQELQESLDIPILVVSTTGLSGNVEGDALCHEDDDPDLICFRPSPLNTRGEAKGLAELKSKMPFADFSQFEADPDVTKVWDVFTVDALVRYVMSKVNA